jgi:hypothetical protein
LRWRWRWRWRERERARERGSRPTHTNDETRPVSSYCERILWQYAANSRPERNAIGSPVMGEQPSPSTHALFSFRHDLRRHAERGSGPAVGGRPDGLFCQAFVAAAMQCMRRQGACSLATCDLQQAGAYCRQLQTQIALLRPCLDRILPLISPRSEGQTRSDGLKRSAPTPTPTPA